ncbi:MAG: HD domain-containing protein [Dehalococcoidales bacterium]|nr:HD domain-containing protein [Dehalococcoidales bacterium]
MQYAQPGIQLSTDVYDSFGNIIMEKGTRLTFDNVSILGQMGGGELFFEDRRVDDVPVTPLLPERLEGEAARQLRAFFDLSRNVALYNSELTRIDTNPIEKIVYSMVGQLFPVVMGEVNSIGCFSLKDYDFVHPVQVTGLSLLMGRKLGYKEDTLTKLGVAAILQNIGYVALTAGMMSEPDTLDTINKYEVQQHCQYGYQIMKEYTNLDPDILTAILHHHEQWNGEGYPFGLKGESISKFARIITIADIYYSMVSRRPYRNSYLPHEAIEYVMAYSGEFFEPELVQLFTKLVPLYPTGVMVNLNTGERGIISNANLGFVGRPVIRICYDKSLNELRHPFDMDLTESQHQHRLVMDVVEY